MEMQEFLVELLDAWVIAIVQQINDVLTNNVSILAFMITFVHHEQNVELKTISQFANAHQVWSEIPIQIVSLKYCLSVFMIPIAPTFWLVSIINVLIHAKL